MKLCRKHIVYGVITILISYLFFLTRSEWDPMHAWNRAFANVSLLYLFIIMFLGPFSKIKKGLGSGCLREGNLGFGEELLHSFIFLLFLVVGLSGSSHACLSYLVLLREASFFILDLP